MLAKAGNMMCKLKGWMDKGSHYDEQIKRADGKGRALCVEMKGWMQKGGIMMCKLKGWMD